MLKIILNIFLILFLSIISIVRLNAQDMNAWNGPPKADSDYRHASNEALEQWRDRKFGMRIHWGVYSVLGLDASWPLTHSSKEFQNIYRTLYQVFNPSDFNAEEWADLAENAGMKYFVFTSKHHDGFCMYDTHTKTHALRRVPGYKTGNGGGIGPVEDCYINYSIMNTSFKRDILGELIKAFRKKGMGIGVYYSHIDWNDPDFRWDPKAPDYDSTYSQKTDPGAWKRFIEREKAQLNEITTRYGKIDQLALDGNWPTTAIPNLVKIIKMVRKNQPDILMRHRGIGPYGDYQTPEHWIPTGPDDPRLNKPWQAIEQYETDWAWTPNGEYHSKEWILKTLIETVSMGGNFMVGISPMPNGKFPDETVKSLLWVGKWLKINGEAIYKTRPYFIFKEGRNIFYTRSKDNKYVYAIHIGQPGEKIILKYAAADSGSIISIAGYNGKVNYVQTRSKLTIDIPADLKTKLGDQYAYVFKIEGKDYAAAPVLKSSAEYTIGKPIIIELSTPTAGAKIYYTLDGSMPGKNSDEYTGPITITKSGLFKAVAIKAGLMKSPPVIKSFSILDKRKNGLKYYYYEGSWKYIPDFSKLTPTDSGYIYNFDFSKFQHREDHFGMRITGYIKIPKSGNYTFYTATDDGSFLYIDDKLLVDNDGSHAATEKKGRINLTAGMHKIRLDYFEDYEGQEISIKYEGPGIDKMDIPFESYYRVNKK